MPLLDASVRMRVPAGTQSGAVFRIRGKGLLKATGGRGDAHVRVMVEVPTALDDRQRELLLELATLRGEERAEPRLTPATNGVFSRLRDRFSGR